MTAKFPDISEDILAAAAERRNESEVGIVCRELVHFHVVPATMEARFDQQVIARVRQDVYAGCRLLIHALSMPVFVAHTETLRRGEADIITTQQRPYDMVMTMSHILGEERQLFVSTIGMMLVKYIEFFSQDPETLRMIGGLEEKLNESARNAIILEIRAMKIEVMDVLKGALVKIATNVEVGRPALADAIQSSISRLLRIKNGGVSMPSATFLTAEGIFVHCNTDTMKIRLRDRKSHEAARSIDPFISSHIRLPLPIEWAPQIEVEIPIS